MQQRQVEESIARHGDTVRRVCFLYLSCYADVEDVFQETFLRLLTCKKPFADQEHQKAWLIRVARNLCADLLRRKKRHPALSLEEYDHPIPQKEESGPVLEAVLGLPPNYRLAIYLHCVEGYAADEIAAMVHRRPNTVYSWLHRGRALLRQTLEGGTTDA